MIFQTQSTSIRPLTTAHLAQTMTLMELNALEISQKIETELASNPALEKLISHHCPHCSRPLTAQEPCPLCKPSVDLLSNSPIVFVSPRYDFTPYKDASMGEIPNIDFQHPGSENLDKFVLGQIAPELCPQDRIIASYILCSLDEDGLLRQPLIEIARYHHVPLSRINKIISIIQHAEPIGVGSPSPHDALLVQLEVLSETRSIPEKIMDAVKLGMDLLPHHQYSQLARLLEITPVEAKEITKFIGDNLNPYPARAYWGDSHVGSSPVPDVYHRPDVIITFLNESLHSPLVIEIISPFAGRLRVDPQFKKALAQAPSEHVEKWEHDIEQASLLVKCLKQRDHTLVRLMKFLAEYQRAFIIKGDVHLLPITRANLAKKLDLHESTISRAVSNKAVQLPNRHIIPLSKFFDRSLPIRSTIRQIIANETKPLTDTQLVKLLKIEGYTIARRTVAKYRSIEGILPAHLRAHSRRSPG